MLICNFCILTSPKNAFIKKHVNIEVLNEEHTDSLQLFWLRIPKKKKTQHIARKCWEGCQKDEELHDLSFPLYTSCYPFYNSPFLNLDVFISYQLRVIFPHNAWNNVCHRFQYLIAVVIKQLCFLSPYLHSLILNPLPTLYICMQAHTNAQREGVALPNSL